MLTLHDLQVQAIIYNELMDTTYMSSRISREIKPDVTWSCVKRQTACAKMTSAFVFFPSNRSLNHIKIEKCLQLFATNTNIFTLLLA